MPFVSAIMKMVKSLALGRMDGVQGFLSKVVML